MHVMYHITKAMSINTMYEPRNTKLNVYNFQDPTHYENNIHSATRLQENAT